MDVVHRSLQRAFITQILFAKHAEKDNFVTLFVWVHFTIKSFAGEDQRSGRALLLYELLNAPAVGTRRAVVK
jgi:hypothetical protein